MQQLPCWKEVFEEKYWGEPQSYSILLNSCRRRSRRQGVIEETAWYRSTGYSTEKAMSQNQNTDRIGVSTPVCCISSLQNYKHGTLGRVVVRRRSSHPNLFVLPIRAFSSIDRNNFTKVPYFEESTNLANPLSEPRPTNVTSVENVSIISAGFVLITLCSSK